MCFKYTSRSLFLHFMLFWTALSAESLNEKNKKAYEYLDTLAIQAGTDKSSLAHHYTKTYSKYFAPLRKEKIKLLEIGIFYGNSVKLWESYFVNGELHFVDINAERIQYHSNRSHYHFVDQENIAEMQALATNLGGNFDIILDDGGHLMTQQINSFKALFPSLKSGGLYVIEDLHTSYWSAYGGGGAVGAPASTKGTCVEFLKGLIDDLNYTAGVTATADFDKAPPDLKATLNAYQSQIESIHFYQSLCIILKK